MPDYEPLDLSPHCNAGKEAIPFADHPPSGRTQLHGLPFLFGKEDPAASDHYVAFCGAHGAANPVDVPVNKHATYLIFCHVLSESNILDGGDIGRTVFHYHVSYGDGRSVRIPVRERLEVGFTPQVWGQWPLVAATEAKPFLHARHAGPWNHAGVRQQMASLALGTFTLWAWKNPHPHSVIVRVTLEPGDRGFLVGGITLSHLDEYPLLRTGRKAVKITLPKEKDASKPFGLSVDVDRGVAIYPFPLPSQSNAAFLQDALRGFGQEKNSRASPAYVEIGAIPSATVTIQQDGDTLGKLVWGELEKHGRIEQERVHVEVVDKGRNWVHVKVLDAATGRPVPCRVHFRSPDGIPYQPHGHHNHLLWGSESWHYDLGGELRLGQVTYAYIPGQCQGWLPRGEVIVDIARGFEYQPLRRSITVRPGQREVTLRIKRWTHMQAQGWFSGDTHVHFLGTQGAHFEARGEDLQVVNLLQSQWGHLFTNTEDFTGGASVSEDGRSIVYCSQENRQHILGHLSLLGLKEPVYPWCTGGPGEGEIGGTLEETMSRWADACHAQGGTVIVPHMPNPNGEPAALIATGRADAVEMLLHADYPHREYYRYLNCGYRLPLVGGTDKMCSDVPVGLCRTYVKLLPGDPFTYGNWLKALHAGRTFLTSGPMMAFTAEGKDIGDVLRVSKHGGSIEVEASAESIFPIHTLQIVRNGHVVAAAEAARGANKLRLKETIRVPGHSWIAARCAGPKYDVMRHHDTWRRGIFAHTSPIYIEAGEPWRMFDKDTAEYMLTLIEGGIRHIREASIQYPQDTVTHHHGFEDHLAYLEAPFHEARKAIHRRMHAWGIPH